MIFVNYYPVAIRLFAALALLFSMSSAPGAGQQNAPATLHLAVPSITALDWPMYVAQELGFYKRNGLDVEMTQLDPNTIPAALVGGSIDIALGDALSEILVDDKGGKLVAVGSGIDNNPYKLMSSAPIKTIAGLKGAKISATSRVNVYTIVMREILRKGGLNPDRDVEWVFGGGQNQRIAAMLGGAVQAGLANPPWDAKLAERGFNTLAFTPDYYPHLQLSITLVRRDWAQAHASVLRRYLLAMAQAGRWIADPANKARALEILARDTHSTPAEAAESYDDYVTRGHDFENDYCTLRPGMVTLLGIMHARGQTPSTPADVGKYIDPQWCPKLP